MVAGHHSQPFLLRGPTSMPHAPSSEFLVLARTSPEARGLSSAQASAGCRSVQDVASTASCGSRRGRRRSGWPDCSRPAGSARGWRFMVGRSRAPPSSPSRGGADGGTGRRGPSVERIVASEVRKGWRRSWRGPGPCWSRRRYASARPRQYWAAEPTGVALVRCRSIPAGNGLVGPHLHFERLRPAAPAERARGTGGRGRLTGPCASWRPAPGLRHRIELAGRRIGSAASVATCRRWQSG